MARRFFSVVAMLSCVALITCGLAHVGPLLVQISGSALAALVLVTIVGQRPADKEEPTELPLPKQQEKIEGDVVFDDSEPDGPRNIH